MKAKKTKTSARKSLLARLNNHIRIVPFIVLILAVPAVFVVYMLYAFFSFNGGWEGLVRDVTPAPDFHSRNMVEKRENTQQSLDKAFTLFDNSKIFSKYSSVSSHDECGEGQYNSKVQDDYEYQCIYRITKFYGLNGNLKEDILRLQDDLEVYGWRSPDLKETLNLLNEYSDGFYSITNEDGQVKKYPISGQSMSAYSDNHGNLEVIVDYAGRREAVPNNIRYAQNVKGDTFGGAYDNKDFIDYEAAFAELSKNNQYVLIVSAQKTYYEK